MRVFLQFKFRAVFTIGYLNSSTTNKFNKVELNFNVRYCFGFKFLILLK